MIDNKLDIAILAAGKGTRMGMGTPKVLIKLKGKPMICHLLDSIDKTTSKNPFIIVSLENIKELKGALRQYQCRFVIQKEQLGTGHAVGVLFSNRIKLASNLLILYGDHPLISSKTIQKLASKHNSSDSVFTMLVANVPQFSGIYRNFYHDGRIVRDSRGDILKIVEPSDADKNIMAIREINPAIFIFKTDWLKNNIGKIKINRVKREYYLTQLIEIAKQGNTHIQLVEGDISECFGVNTESELEVVEKVFDKQKNN